MKSIVVHSYNKTLDQDFTDFFDSEKTGLYLFEITASAKSWWQNIVGKRTFFKKDSLAFTLNAKAVFTALKKKKLRANDLWNGNVLNGNDKTVYIITRLSKGKATLEFSVHGRPFLKEINVVAITNRVQLENLVPSKRDRIPWLTFLVSEDIVLSKFSITAKTSVTGNDDEDLQLIIDGVKERNQKNTHKDWYWCGYALRGKSLTFEKTFEQGSEPSMIDIVADGIPVVQTFSLDVSDVKRTLGRIALTKDIDVSEEVNIRAESNTQSKIIAKARNAERVEILTRVVEGEEVLNKSNIWHRINYKGFEGYVHSSFVEIDGDERDHIIEKIRHFALKHQVDQDLAIALAGCESQYKPYAVSFTGAKGIFQLTGAAREQLLESFHFSIGGEDLFNSDKNIEGGILYLKWVSSLYENATDRLRKIIAAWNAGHSRIPTKGTFDLSRLTTAKKKEVEELIECVAKKKKKKDWRFISLLLVIALLFGAGCVYAFTGSGGNNRGPVFAFQNTFQGGAVKSVRVYLVQSQKLGFTTTSVDYTIGHEQKHIELEGYLENAYMLGDMYFRDTFLFIVRETGQYITTSILRYDPLIRDLVFVPFVRRDGTLETELCCAFVTFQPWSYANYALVMYDYSRYSQAPGEKRNYKYDSERHIFLEHSRDKE